MVVFNVFVVNQTHKTVHFRGHKIRQNKVYGFRPKLKQHGFKCHVHRHSKIIATFRINKYGFIHDFHSKSHLTKDSVILNMRNYIKTHGLVIKLLEHGRGHGYGCFLGNRDRFTLFD